MRTPGLVLAMALVLAQAAPALAARPTPTPSPGGKLPIQGVTVDVQPIEAAPGLPAAAPEGSHVEQPPLLRLFRALPIAGHGDAPLRGFKPAAPKAMAKPRPSASPSRKPAP